MAPNTSDPLHCHTRTTVASGLPTTSAVMFVAGAVGNIIALALLELRRRSRKAPSLFRILVTALVVTDLLGTVSVSPVVLASYTWDRSLVAMRGYVCSYFGFSMTLLSLSTLAILCAMALERFLSLGFPYFYERNLDPRCGYVTITLIFLVCAVFCALPFVGLGSYVQYCPGTWCFLDMSSSVPSGEVYTGLYATFTLVMITVTLGCNVSVICFLAKMHRRQKAHRSAAFSRRSMTEEMEHLLPLVFITVTFVVCSVPLLLRVYINFMGWREERHAADLWALRMLSFNSIIDPWVFITFSPSVLKFISRKLRRRRSPPAGGEAPAGRPLELQDQADPGRA